MNILHVCREYESGVRRTMSLCDKHLETNSRVLVIDDSSVSLQVTVDGGTAPYYTALEEQYFQPDVILEYGDLEEEFTIEPRCPKIHMGERYAMALWPLPKESQEFKRSYPLSPKACKVVYDQSETDTYINNPSVSADVFDVWVFNKFDAERVACAMSWSCIPVVPAGSGAEDWIAHGITGVLYHNEFERDNMVQELKNDPMLRRDIAEAARHWVHDHADIRILEDLLDRIRGI